MIRMITFLILVVPGFLSASGVQEGKILTKWSYPQQITKIQIITDRHDVAVQNQESGVSGRLLGDDSDDWSVKQTGDLLVIRLETQKTLFNGQLRTGTVELQIPSGLSLEITTASGNVNVRVPVETLKVQTASGGICARSGGRFADLASASGSIQAEKFTDSSKIQTYAGDVTVDNFRGSLDAGTLSGTLTIQKFAGDLTAQSSSGQVQIRQLEGSLRYTNVSGNLAAEGLFLAGDSRLHSTSGNIQLKLVGKKDSYKIRAQSVSGTVKISPSSSQTAGPHPIAIELESVSGNIETEW